MVWPLNRRFKDGKLLTPPLLGYDRPKDVTGRYIKYAPLEINKAEARIVNFIYDAYLIGWSKERIANFLTEIGCQTKTGATEWSAGSIYYILSNERYCGDVLTWKPSRRIYLITRIKRIIRTEISISIKITIAQLSVRKNLKLFKCFWKIESSICAVSCLFSAL